MSLTALVPTWLRATSPHLTRLDLLDCRVTPPAPEQLAAAHQAARNATGADAAAIHTAEDAVELHEEEEEEEQEEQLDEEERPEGPHAGGGGGGGGGGGAANEGPLAGVLRPLPQLRSLIWWTPGRGASQPSLSPRLPAHVHAQLASLPSLASLHVRDLRALSLEQEYCAGLTRLRVGREPERRRGAAGGSGGRGAGGGEEEEDEDALPVPEVRA